ncbi:hypothetical protein GPECTOR_218g460 [Gonium pectorale]|uniref:Fungal lipase-type domain-containing protein n=1 Tax=Gonium pectorale TaxID=33097 RepID=A0A150FWQ7_GONPE|nr:hypothetical protein GPECTOR_218g460 [Gonium pectorale]|eukprot:KXZ42036.1 hypothetical protein GPECTOR_218g460 [Gonium pectorale]
MFSRRRESSAEELLREVLSPRSAYHAELAAGFGRSPAGGTAGTSAEGGATPLESAAAEAVLGSRHSAGRSIPLHDPAIATVFSRGASRRLPRLARGPSVSLSPLPGQPQPAPRPDGEHRSGRIGAADPPPPELDVGEALVAGRLASIAYCSRPDLISAWNCTRCADVPGFTPYATVYDAIWDLAAYAGYYKPWNAIVLAFRGTDSSNWGQWAENMRYWRTDTMFPEPGFPHALIHSGFWTLWTGSRLQASFKDAVAELLAAHPGARLVATGHSMGGALAQLAGLEAKLAHNDTHTSVWTFGAPRLGNLAYQQLFNQFVDVSWRFTHNRDIVPSVPLQLMGFQHVAREVWEVDVEDPSKAGGAERKLLLCDASGEDPSCHNSACYLGLCTSVADHLVYLGLHMYQDSDEC